ncbi:bifunctional hydroxymethylpyrimidine kinase/phosphomethylpyrimidine kinase [soil metagenome]
MTFPPAALVNALYTGSDRGLSADLLAADALAFAAYPVCSALVMASRGRVTDVTEVPADTVAAQLEHLATTAGVSGIKAAVMPNHAIVDAVVSFAHRARVPLIVDVRLSGPSGETVMTSRAMDRMSEWLDQTTLLIMRADEAALFTGGEIASLDDAQVAAQRAFRQGAKQVVIRCGPLPARFHDAADDPGLSESRLNADLFYDGEDFALFETPLIPESPEGSDDAFGTAVLQRLVSGESIISALQHATRFVAEAQRNATSDPLPRLGYRWK